MKRNLMHRRRKDMQREIVFVAMNDRVFEKAAPDAILLFNAEMPSSLA
jgi:hypothetical protein